jgi:acyl carrier protein
MPDLNQGASRDRLFEVVQRILAANLISRPVSIDEPLHEAGMNSIDMISLMLAVEAEFGIVIPDSEITIANFQSISTIEALIAKIVTGLDDSAHISCIP